MAASQTKSASPITTPVISASDPFIALSQAVNDDSSLVITLSSIPSSDTHKPDANLSFDNESKEVFKDFEDEPTMKKRISNSDEEDNGVHETEAMGTYSLHLLGFLSHPLLLSSLPFFFFNITF